MKIKMEGILKMIGTMICSGCVLILTAGNSVCSAQSDSSHVLENLSLKELLSIKVTTVSKASEELEMAAATIVVVTKAQIKIRGYQSLLDVLYDLPDIKIDDKVYSGIRSSFTVRGVQGQDKFIILLDGVRISSPIDEALPIMENYPVNLVEQIEIVYGPASALYGANAVSGVINIITQKSAKDEISVEGSSLNGNYGYTNNQLMITKKLSDEVSMIISGQYYFDKQPDLNKTFNNDPQTNSSSYESGTINTVFGPVTPIAPVSANFEAPMSAYNIYAAIHSSDFTLSYFRNSTTTPSAYGSNVNNALYNKEAAIKQGIDVVNASYKKSFGQLNTVSSLTASNFVLDPKSNYRNLYTGFEPAYKYESSTSIKGEEQLNFEISPRINLTGGISYELFSVVPYSGDLQDPVNPNAAIQSSYLGTKNYYSPNGIPAHFFFLRYSNTGSFLQAQYSPVKKLIFSLGARYDYNTRYGNTLNPRISGVYKPFNKTTIKVMFGSAYLAPSVSSSYAQWGSFVTADSGKTYSSYFLHLPNPNLKPITSRTYELSIKQYFTNNLSLTVEGYYTALDNLLGFADDNATTHLYNNQFFSIPVDYIEVYVNQGRQENYGGSIQLNWKTTVSKVKLNSFASVSYTDGIIQSALREEDELTPDAKVDFISKFIVHAGIECSLGKFTIAPRAIFMTEQSINGIADTVNGLLQRQSIPGYTLLNISARYNISRQFSFFANASNVLNVHYRSVGFLMDLKKPDSDLFYGQPEDLLRIMAGVNFKF